MSYASHGSASNPYCQAAGFRPRRSNTMGIAGLIISIVGLLVTCGLLCPVGLLFSLIGLTKSPRGEAIAGTIIGGFGTAAVVAVVGFFALASAAVVTAGVEIENQAITVEALQGAEMTIEEYRYANNALPEGIEGNKLVIPFTDAWGTSLRYEPEDNAYRIRSAGADTRFDTRDDILAGLSFDAEFDHNDSESHE